MLLLWSLYFFYFSRSSHANLSRLSQKIEELEHQAERLEIEKRNLENFLRPEFLETPEKYLRDTGHYNPSNEIVVNIQIPDLPPVSEIRIKEERHINFYLLFLAVVMAIAYVVRQGWIRRKKTEIAEGARVLPRGTTLSPKPEKDRGESI